MCFQPNSTSLLAINLLLPKHVAYLVKFQIFKLKYWDLCSVFSIVTLSARHLESGMEFLKLPCFLLAHSSILLFRTCLYYFLYDNKLLNTSMPEFQLEVSLLLYTFMSGEISRIHIHSSITILPVKFQLAQQFSKNQ